MSKRKRLLGVFALALTAAVAAVFGVGVTATAAAPDFSGTNLQILNVGEADPHGTTNVMSVSLHINKHLGTNGFVVTTDASKVVYTQKMGGTRTLSGASLLILQQHLHLEYYVIYLCVQQLCLRHVQRM